MDDCSIESENDVHTDIVRSGPPSAELSASDEPLGCTHLTGHVNTDHDSQCIVVYGEGHKSAVLQLSWEADSIWTLRLHTLLLQCARLQMQMAWFSTLGGAYSSLGEHLPTHAHQAGVISLKQVALANEMGNPLLAAKCKLFIAWSLMQRGKLEEAAAIIKSQYQFVLQEATVDDSKLKTMCQAAWVRLKLCRKMQAGSQRE